MCEISKEYKLCTCDDLAPNDKKNIWTLTRYIGHRKTDRIGKILRTSDDLGNGISREQLILQMNTKNCFDFEYIPNENDSLHVSTNDDNTYKYFNIIYKNGLWIEGGNPVFTSITETIAEGKIEIID